MNATRRPRWLWWLLSATTGVTVALLAVLAWLRERAGGGATAPPPAPTATVTVTSAPSAATSPPPPASSATGTVGAPSAGCRPSCRGTCGESCDATCSKSCDQAAKSCDSSAGSCDHAVTCHDGSGCVHVQGCGGAVTGLLAAWCAVGPRGVRPRVTLPARAGVLAVRGYQRWISPRLRAHCRYVPSCSGYGIDALRTYGALTGSRLTLARIRRCTPDIPCGTPDPVGRRTY